MTPAAADDDGRVRPEEGTETVAEHYFTAQPVSAAERRPIAVTLAGHEVHLWTAAGIFSPDHVDQGTQVLLDEAPPPPPTGNFLDIGCGWGPLALTMGLLSPGAQIWGVDVNERALDLARLNAAQAGVTATFARPHEIPEEIRFDLIWSNPPIRVGKAVLHEILATWLPRLTDAGTAYLVVQKNLGADSLEKWIRTDLSPLTASRYASRKGFRILQVRRAN